jgi:hypothetical protein
MVSGIVDPNYYCNLNCKFTSGDRFIEIQQILNFKLTLGDASMKIQKTRDDKQSANNMKVKLNPGKSTKAFIQFDMSRFHDAIYKIVLVVGCIYACIFLPFASYWYYQPK